MLDLSIFSWSLAAKGSSDVQCEAEMVDIPEFYAECFIVHLCMRTLPKANAGFILEKVASA